MSNSCRSGRPDGLPNDDDGLAAQGQPEEVWLLDRRGQQVDLLLSEEWLDAAGHLQAGIPEG